MMNLQKIKKTGTLKEQGSRKKDKKKDQKTPVTLTPSSGKITKYFVRKQREEDDIKQLPDDKTYQEQNNGDILSQRRQEQELSEKTGRYQEILKLRSDTGDMKTTFTSALNKESVKNKIARFEDIRNKSEECVIASGMCGLHHCRVERDIRMKRVSYEDKLGNTQWTMREGTILVCPLARKPGIEQDSNLSTESQYELRGTTTNKKLRFTTSIEDNESQH